MTSPTSPTLYAYCGADRTDPHAVALDLDDHARACVLAMPKDVDVAPITVTDRTTGQRWAVRPTACPGDCYCALEAYPLPALVEDEPAEVCS